MDSRTALALRGLPALVALALTALTIVTLSATPASAHGRSTDATNFDSRITSVPELDGVRWQMHGDEYLSLDNPTDREILVLGYEGEPWLRVGPDGVHQNVRSAATYVNADRYAQVPVPDTVDPEAPPEWEQLSGGHSWYWHDHRTHWMAPTAPPAVRAGDGREVVVQEWEVPLVIGDEETAVTGQLWWIPAPSPLPWLLAGLLASTPALLGLRKRSDRAAALIRPAALVLGVIALVNLMHLVDDFFAAPAPAGSKAFAAAQTATFIAVALFGAVRGWQAREGSFTALGIGSASAFIGQGLLYLPALTSSQLQSVLPDPVGRFAIGLSLMQILTVGLVAVVGTRRFAPVPLEGPHETEDSESGMGLDPGQA